MHVISHSRLRTADYRCLFNTSRFSSEEVADLLNDGAAKLFADAEHLADKRGRSSYRLSIGSRTFYARVHCPASWYEKVRDRLLMPACMRRFKAADRLLSSKLRTPPPILAAVIYRQQRQQQILVTDYCEEALGLDDYVEQQDHDDGYASFIHELADVLTDFHRCGFHSRYLRSGTILVQQQNDKRLFWFTDLEGLSCSRFLPRSCFVTTVARAVGQMYEHLPQKDRRFLLVTCFDYALKKNIYPKPSQQERFVESTLRLIRDSHPQS